MRGRWFMCASFVVLSIMPFNHCSAQFTDILKAIIKAIDLGVQRAQNRVIDLQNAQKALENILSETKLKEIGEWVEKHRAQYAEYFDELKKVKDVINGYSQAKGIMSKQVTMVKEYARAISLFRQSGTFTPEELSYMLTVYTGMIDVSVRNLDQLALVVNSFQTEMTDGKRLEIIAVVNHNMDLVLNDLRAFNSQNAILSLQRVRNLAEVERLKSLFGIK